MLVSKQVDRCVWRIELHIYQKHIEMSTAAEINALIAQLPVGEAENVSDTYHTFQELYDCRLALNAALLNAWAAVGLYNVYKSLNHSNGEPCFEGKEWFIVGAHLPDGDISFHYPCTEWNLFKVDELPCGKVWDGHTTADVGKRIRLLCERRQ